MLKPYYQDQAVTIYHGKCEEIVPQLGKFDLLLTDPPYEVVATGGGHRRQKKIFVGYQGIHGWGI